MQDIAAIYIKLFGLFYDNYNKNFRCESYI